MIKKWLLCITVIVSFVATKAFSAHILVVESYHAEYLWDIEYKKGLQESLGKEHQFSFVEMDTKRVLKRRIKFKAEMAWQDILSLRPDIVVLGDDNALKFLAPKLRHTSIPVVYLGINNNPRNYDVVGATNITGVLERPLLKRSVLLTKEILTQANKGLVLLDSGATSIASLNTEFDNQSHIKVGDLKVEVELIERYPLWKEKVLNAKKNGFDFIFIGLYHTIRNSYGEHVNAEEVLSWTSKNSPVPTFGFWAMSIGAGKASGGLVLSGVEQGKEAAEIIKAILAGEPISEMRPRIAEKGRLLFSSSEVNKWKLVIPDFIANSALWVE